MNQRRVKIFLKFLIVISGCFFFLYSNIFRKNEEENFEKKSGSSVLDMSQVRLAKLEDVATKDSAIDMHEYYFELEKKPFELPKNFGEEHDDVITPHNFDYLHQPKFDERCTQKSLNGSQLSVVLIHSEAGNFQQRATIRRTWATVGQQVTKIVFLLGNPHNKSTQRQIGEESNKYGDLLQENFHESYRNITLKAVMGMKYIATKCPTFTYVCKSDDDMFVKIQIIHNLLASPETPESNLILCRVSTNAKVERDGKYEVSTSIYNQAIWPPFCFGGFWIASTDVFTRLYDASLHTPQLHLDDVYMTGMLREKLGLKLHKFKPKMIFCHARGSWRIVEDWWKYVDSIFMKADIFEDEHPDMIPLCGKWRRRWLK